MKKLFIFLFLAFGIAKGQQIQACKQRFDAYLNFRGSLSAHVKFEKDAIVILNSSGRKELVIYEEEIPVLARFFKQSSLKEQEEVLKLKGQKKFSKKKLDSLGLQGPRDKIVAKFINDKQPLNGYRIALDPGHFATTLSEAKIEQKYLYFLPADPANRDTVKLFESFLTYNTASMLKAMLEEQGATVELTRDAPNHTSFDCTFSDWIKFHKKKVLDSLRNRGLIPPQKYQVLMKGSDYNLFWNFFRDFDLANRANKINQFNPDITIIIHFNVDEKNMPWTKHSQKNFSMTFIGGAFTSDNLERPEGRVNFLRLLLTDQLNHSQALAAHTVLNFHKHLDIEIAKQADADYLKNNCLTTSSPGVFCRNLALCRKINSPLVYGESLYQDNEKESALLMRSDLDHYGIRTNERLKKVATSYYEGLMEFLRSE